MNQWVCAKPYCTCAGTLDACACAPSPEASDPARYAISSCATCGHEVMYRRACGECARYPCACPAAWRVADALRGLAAEFFLSRCGWGHPTRLLPAQSP